MKSGAMMMPNPINLAWICSHYVWCAQAPPLSGWMPFSIFTFISGSVRVPQVRVWLFLECVSFFLAGCGMGCGMVTYTALDIMCCVVGWISFVWRKADRPLSRCCISWSINVMIVIFLDCHCFCHSFIFCLYIVVSVASGELGRVVM